MKTTFVRIPTSDKLILQGLLFEPDISTKKAVLIVHGMHGNFYDNTYIEVMARGFTQKGYKFFSFNNRGHGYISNIPIVGDINSKKELGSAFETFTDCTLDIQAAIEYLIAQGISDIVLIGHSLGASKVSYYQSITGDNRISKLILLAPVPIIDVLEADPQYSNLVTAAKEMIKKENTNKLMPIKVLGELYMSPKTYLQYIKRGSESDVFSSKPRDSRTVISSIQVPVLAFFGSSDKYRRFISISQNLDYLKATITHTDVKTYILDGAGHSFTGYENELVEKIINWILT